MPLVRRVLKINLLFRGVESVSLGRSLDSLDVVLFFFFLLDIYKYMFRLVWCKAKSRACRKLYQRNAAHTETIIKNALYESDFNGQSFYGILGSLALSLSFCASVNVCWLIPMKVLRVQIRAHRSRASLVYGQRVSECLFMGHARAIMLTCDFVCESIPSI